MLPILGGGIDGTRSGSASSGTAGTSAMEGAGKGTGDDIGGEEDRRVDAFRRKGNGARCSSTICALYMWTTFLIN